MNANPAIKINSETLQVSRNLVTETLHDYVKTDLDKKNVQIHVASPDAKQWKIGRSDIAYILSQLVALSINQHSV